MRAQYDAWKTWTKNLPELPNDDYARITQISKELAEGVVNGYWRNLPFKDAYVTWWVKNDARELYGLGVAHLAWRLSGNRPTFDEFLKGNSKTWFSAKFGGYHQASLVGGLKDSLHIAGYLQYVDDGSFSDKKPALYLSSKAFECLRTEPTKLEKLSNRQLVVEILLLLVIAIDVILRIVGNPQ